jgi:hypothetical protein
MNLQISAVETNLSFLYISELTIEDCLLANGKLYIQTDVTEPAHVP